MRHTQVCLLAILLLLSVLRLDSPPFGRVPGFLILQKNVSFLIGKTITLNFYSLMHRSCLVVIQMLFFSVSVIDTEAPWTLL